MLIEPLEPLTVRLPEGEKRLIPGKTYPLSKQLGEKLLAKAPDKVRVFKPDWVGVWRDLAQSTNGITKDDSRFEPVCEALEKCDSAFEKDDWNTFCRINDQIKEILAP